MTNPNSLPLDPKQQKRLKKAFCECPTCKMGRDEIPPPSDLAMDTLIAALELYKEESRAQSQPYLFVAKWLSRFFMFGYAQGYAQATQGESYDHHDQD